MTTTRTVLAATLFAALAPLSASAQLTGSCGPCPAPGSCPPVTLFGTQDHSCEDHAGHTHAWEAVIEKNMRYTDFTGANMELSFWTRCDFTGALLVDANFDTADLRGTVFNGADLSGAVFFATDAHGADFCDATMVGADFEKAFMGHSEMRNADLRDAIFLRSRAFGVDFTGADLTGANFAVCIVEQADFSGATLTDVTGLHSSIGVARYDCTTDFTGTNFNPAANGWVNSDVSCLAVPFCTGEMNSTGQGAELSATGSLTWIKNSISLFAGPVPASEMGVFFYSPTQVAAQPFGEGMYCLSGPVHRLWPVVAASAGGVLQHDLNVYASPNGPAGYIAPSSTWNFQAWYSDSAGGPSGFNLSSGLSITWEP